MNVDKLANEELVNSEMNDKKVISKSKSFPSKEVELNIANKISKSVEHKIQQKRNKVIQKNDYLAAKVQQSDQRKKKAT